MIIWLTGKSGSGKTTLANELVKIGWVKLDGDDMRASITADCDLTKEGREENNVRVAKLAKVLDEQHNIIVSVIAPTNEIRAKVHRICKPHWVYIKSNKDSYFDQIFEEPKYVQLIINTSKSGMNKESSLKALKTFITEVE